MALRTPLLACTLALAACANADHHAGWSYGGETGPEHWGDLGAANAACGDGRMQSPIDLADPLAVGDLEVSVDWDAGPLTVRNLGKTVQVDFASGSYLTTGGKVFNLVQVHFHTPSEHTVDGEVLPLVGHFVHASDEGALAVVGVLFENGDANPALQQVLDGLDGVGKEPVTVAGATFDPNDLLPDELEAWRYQGSLTTPPCSEGVWWHVLEDTLEASDDQIAAFNRLMGDNARPVQPLNGRLLVQPE